jgi:hypothetical protein
MTKRRESEKGSLSKWLRNGQVGGTAALAKELNRSVSYVEGRLRGFETTRGINRWTGGPGRVPSQSLPGGVRLVHGLAVCLSSIISTGCHQLVS